MSLGLGGHFAPSLSLRCWCQIFSEFYPKIVQNELNFTVLFFKNMIVIIFVYVQCDLRELKNKQTTEHN